MFRRTRSSSDFAEEIKSHLELEADELRQQGLTEAEVQRRARVQFGNVAAAQESFNLRNRVVWLDNLLHDTKFAIRQLAKNPGFAATAILVLALGMGASAAIFAFVDAALIQPLPYAQPNRLVDVDEGGPAHPRSNLSYDDYQDWKRMNTSLDSLDVYTGMGYLLQLGTVTEPIAAERVSDGFFRTLGVEPILGRNFLPGEDRSGQAKITIITYGTWMRRFAGRSNVIGQPVRLSGDTFTIVGVLPRDFVFAPGEGAEFWVPLLDRSNCEVRRTCHNLDAVGRLRDEVTPQTALMDLKRVAARLAIQYPDSNNDRSASVQPLKELIVGKIQPVLLALLGGAGLLLVIACVNVASLLLVRSEARSHEIAVREALGATTGRLVRQFITEGLSLAVVGGGAGMLTAELMMELLKRAVPKTMAEEAPFLNHVGLNPHTVMFAAGVTLLAAALTAITPALRLREQDIHKTLSEGTRTAAGRFWRRLGANLVVVELTVAVVLLVGAGLLGKSLFRLLQQPMGFNPEHLATVNLMMPGHPYSSPGDLVALYREVERRVSNLPGVADAGLTTDLPVRCNCDTEWIRIAGRPFHGEHNDVMQRDISAGYFHALRAKLVRGRMFTDLDDASHPRTSIINETLARKYFPGEDPIGKMLGNPALDPKSMRQVVGVVADIREAALDDGSLAAEYYSIYNGPDNFFSLVVRTGGNEKAIVPEIVKTLRGISPELGVYGEATMPDLIRERPTAVLHQLSAGLIGGFAAISLILGMVGLYGVVAYAVSRRTREIGLRIALGAQRGAVYALILREAVRLSVIGILAGLTGALAVSRLMRSLLFDVSTWDLSILGGVAAALAIAALIASYIPARRASLVSPVDALRSE